MQVKPKLFVPDSIGYAKPFLDIFDLVDEIPQCDVVMFTGGADINPAFYGEPRGRFTDHPGRRCEEEKEIYDQAFGLKKKFIGICRGAQLLCAMAGGTLAQHIENHVLGYSLKHRTVTSDGRELMMNSIHHQMMIPWATKHDMLAWCENLSPVHLDGYNKNVAVEVEPEVVYFHDNQGLGIQCHPEGGYSRSDPTMLYFKELIKERLL